MKRVITDIAHKYADGVIVTHNYKVDKTVLADESLLRSWYKRCFRDFPNYEDWFVNSFLGINNLKDDDELNISFVYAEDSNGRESLTACASCEEYNFVVTGSAIQLNPKQDPYQQKHISQVPMFSLHFDSGVVLRMRATDPRRYGMGYDSNFITDEIQLHSNDILNGNDFSRLVPHIVNEGLDEIVKHPTESVLKHIKTIKAETDDYTPKSL